MRRAFTILGLMMALASGAIAQRNQAAIDLQAAIRTETVDGDLQKAIREYGEVVSKHKSDRATAATALVRMADCYQKLGDAQARSIYERVVREFADQSQQVVLARARLGNTPPIGMAGDRAVWTGPDVDLTGRVSPDGKFLTYVDWTHTGNLMVRDLENGVSRPLTAKKSWNEPGEASYSAISRDGKEVVYSWHDHKGNIALRISPLHTTGVPRFRELSMFSEKEIRFFSLRDWSPDGKWIATSISRLDGTGQIAVVSTADGSLRVLKSVGWQTPDGMFFSPDGRYIAYDLPASDTSDQSDIFVLAVDGSREIAAVVHAANEEVMGWSPDGRQLLFSSDRTGSNGLWALPFANGEILGTQEFLRGDIGRAFSLGLRDAGSLYVYKGISGRDVKIAPIDLVAGKLTGSIADFQQGFLHGARSPEWSPDGKFLAYSACNGNCLAIRSVETGATRQLPRRLLYFREPRWAPDSRSLVIAGRDDKGRNGIFVIDVDSGALTRLIDGLSFNAAPQWSPDGRKLYYSKGAEGYFERDMTSESDRLIFQRRDLFGEVNLSPDGRFLAAKVRDSSTKAFALILVPVSGEEPRELLRLTPPEDFGGMGGFGGFRNAVWTPDGKALLVTKKTESGHQLLLVPIGGEPVRRLNIDPEIWQREALGGPLGIGFTLSPDGRRIAFLVGKNTAEIWALENFLPKPR